MNVHTGRQPTTAEAALVDSFIDRMGELPGDAEIVSARDNAIEALKTQGLPSRRVEAWHYTDLRTLLRSVAAYDGTVVYSRADSQLPRATGLAALTGGKRG